MMKALTLLQPWASLIAVGAKRNETRSWPTWYRGPIVIHASKRYEDDFQELAEMEPFHTALRPGRELVDPALSCGALVAVAELLWVEPTDGFGGTAVPTVAEWHFGDYSPGRFVWRLENVRRIVGEPIQVRGSLGLWTLPAGVAAELRSRELEPVFYRDLQYCSDEWREMADLR